MAAQELQVQVPGTLPRSGHAASSESKIRSVRPLWKLVFGTRRNYVRLEYKSGHELVSEKEYDLDNQIMMFNREAKTTATDDNHKR